jgi:hypothetical protein
MTPSPQEPDDPRPDDPVFLLAILLTARRSRDRLLEELARDWLRETGIHVVFADELETHSNDSTT